MRVDRLVVDQMAPVLVFGGPYSNLQATDALRREALGRALPVTNIICTGDVVAYGADPEPTSALLQQWAIPVVAGNCEEQIAADAADCGCGFAEGSECDVLAKGWYPYANARVSKQTRAWMAGLPAAITFFTGSSQFDFPTGQIAAASVVVTIPIIVMVLIFQRRIVAGLTSGAVKG